MVDELYWAARGREDAKNDRHPIFKRTRNRPYAHAAFDHEGAFDDLREEIAAGDAYLNAFDAFDRL